MKLSTYTGFKRGLLFPFIFILLLLSSLLVTGQSATYEKSVDDDIRKFRKVRKDTLVDMINDSAARTYEYSKKTGKLLLACNKLINGKVTTEYHFDYVHDTLKRVTATVFDLNVRKAGFTTYYFKDRVLVSVSPYESKAEMARSGNDILTKADLMFQRWMDLKGSQSGKTPNRKALAISLEDIRKEIRIINDDTALVIIEPDNGCFIAKGRVTDGGCSLKGYYKNGSIRKIVSWVGLSSGNEIMEFYYKDNHLIFVYEEFRSFVYDKVSGSFSKDSTEKTFSGRYYFQKNKLINYITTGHNRFEVDTVDPEKTLLAEAEAFLSELLKKMKSQR